MSTSPALPPTSATAANAVAVGRAAGAAAAKAITGQAGHHGHITDSQARLLDKVTAAASSNASLSDVNHIVILVQQILDTLVSNPDVWAQTVFLVIYDENGGFFSAGGYKYSGVLDHTSTLRLIESRFGVTVPNLTAWRRSVTGDFTGALNLAATPKTTMPSLPAASLTGDITVVEEAVLNALTGTAGAGIDYPLPASNSMPEQESTPARPAVP